MLISLLQIRSGLKRHKKCCHNFVLPDTVIKKIGTNDVYNNIETELNETDDDNIVHFTEFQF